MSRQRFAALIAAGILGAGTLAFGAAYVIHGFAVGTYFEPGVVSPADLPLEPYRSTAETSTAPRAWGSRGAPPASVEIAENERVPDPPAIGMPVSGAPVLMAQLDVAGGSPGAALLVAQSAPAGADTRETAPEASDASSADPAPDAAPSAGTPAPAVTLRGPQLGDAGTGFVSPASAAPGPDLAFLQLPPPGNGSFGGLGAMPSTGTFPSVVPATLPPTPPPHPPAADSHPATAAPGRRQTMAGRRLGTVAGRRPEAAAARLPRSPAERRPTRSPRVLRRPARRGSTCRSRAA